MTKAMEKFVEAVYCVIDVMDTLRNILSDFFRTPSKYWMRKNKKIVKTRRHSRCRFAKKVCHKMRHREPRAEIGGTGCI